MVEDNGEELRVAIVDVDDNGNYNDPDDLFFVDQNFDMNFEVKEGKTIKKAGSFKLKNKTRYILDFQFLPKKIMVEGKR
jgi:hypothetical protein